MPSQNTVADSIRLLNTGATSSGVAQAVPAGSLGGFISSTGVRSKLFKPSNLPVGFEIAFIAPENINGVGTLTFGGTSATWKAPGSTTAGASVTLPLNTPMVLEDGDDPSHYIRVTRKEDVSVTNITTLDLHEDEYNAISMGEVDETLALAGGFVYRTIGIQNTSASEVTDMTIYVTPLVTGVVSDLEFLPATGAGRIEAERSLIDFPYSGFIAIYSSLGVLKEVVYADRDTFGFEVLSANRGLCGTSATLGAVDDLFYPIYGVELATETPTADAVTASVDENTPPSGITFTGAFSEATALTVASLPAGDWVGLHIKKTVPAGMTQYPEYLGNILVTFTVAGNTYNSGGMGIYRVANAITWKLYVGETIPLDLERDPDASGNTLPISFPLTLPVSGSLNYWYVVRKRNRFGLESLNEYPRRITVTSTGVEEVLPPSSPTGTTLTNGEGGDVVVETNYDKGVDIPNDANRWYIWASIGVDPDPDVDTPVKKRGVPEINRAEDGFALIQTIGPYDPETDVRVVVRMVRTSDSVTDGNTDVITLVTAPAATAPTGVANID